ncbi:flagellar assembly protein FliH [Sporosarcina sp. FA9]|uniref:flagellar assembly protein FliH n=1 Tax=Sporosarcina sp. FA9 TaxID=3413030 RepID=UPI003F65C77C
MSNVFRSQNTLSEIGGTRQIGIRNLNAIEEFEIENQNISLEDIYFERDKILNEAKKEINMEKLTIENMRNVASEDILSMQKAWAEEKEILEQKAYEDGFQIGHEEGRNKALSDMESSIQTANKTTEQSLNNASQYVASQERVILELAMRSAERILGEVIGEDEERFLSIVRRAIKDSREMKEIKLYISQDYFEFISANRAELAAIFPPDVPFLIFANDDFESTECYIETNHGRIVVSVDEQLNEIRERLIEIMESGD